LAAETVKPHVKHLLRRPDTLERVGAFFLASRAGGA
jgi:hypothetical protein